VRVQAAAVATTIAEYFRRRGADVLLLLDSLTRLATRLVADPDTAEELVQSTRIIRQCLPVLRETRGEPVDVDDPKIFGMVQDPQLLEERLRSNLPRHLKGIHFRVDLAHLDPRPINPLRMGEAQIYIYNESSNRIETEILKELFRFIPVRVIQCRIFTLSHEYDWEIASAFHKIFQFVPADTLTTNI